VIVRSSLAAVTPLGDSTFPAVPAGQRRGRSTLISGPPAREPGQADLAIRHIELGALPGVDRYLTKVRSKKFALDSALEEAGFEPSVPLAKQGRAQAWNSSIEVTRRLLRA
jgi:hypothetical protein